MARPTKWIELFHQFIKPLRIFSKEETTAGDSGTPLLLWESQRRFLDEIAMGLEDGVRFFVCLKSRQLGITTVSLVIDVFWCAMFPGTRGALVTDTEANRDANRLIIEGYIRSFPKEYFGEDFKIVRANRQMIEFSNGSILYLLVAGTKKKGVSWAEGKGFAFAHLTEVSKYGDPDALASFMESLAQKNPNRLFIVESTANGQNHYRKMWGSAKKDHATQRPFFIGWWASDVNYIDCNDRRYAQYGLPPPNGEESEKIKLVKTLYGYSVKPEQLAWIRWKENTDNSGGILAQNQPWTEEEAFIQSGYSFFQTRVIGKELEDMQRTVDAWAPERSEFSYDAYRYELGNDFWAMKLERIMRSEDRDRIELKIWEQPHKNGKYSIGFDPAYGRNEHKDRSAISVWRCYADKMVQVAEFASNMVEVKQASWAMAHLAGAYANSVVNIDVNGPGRIVINEWDNLRQMLKAEQYAKIVADRDWDDALQCARWYLYKKQDNQSGGAGAIGFETNWRTKFEIMHQLRGAYTTKELKIRSKFLLLEMANVVQQKDTSEIGAPESSSEDLKDDRVFAAALAVRAWIESWRPYLLSENETYVRMTAEETGVQTVAQKSVNDIVYRFFKRKDEEAEMEMPRAPQWRIDRGLA